MFNQVPVDGKVVCFQPLVIKHRKISQISLCIHLCVHVCVYLQGKLFRCGKLGSRVYISSVDAIAMLLSKVAVPILPLTSRV